MEELIEDGFDQLVALTTGRFQVRLIENCYLAAVMTDDAGVLENADSYSDAGAASSQHLREEFLSDLQ